MQQTHCKPALMESPVLWDMMPCRLVFVCVCVCVYVCMYVCIMYVCMCVYVCMYVCMYVCIHIYILPEAFLPFAGFNINESQTDILARNTGSVGVKSSEMEWIYFQGDPRPPFTSSFPNITFTFKTTSCRFQSRK
jgi:hypothetical protein